MVEPITATYVQEDEDWTITVAGRGRRLTARAPGIIAARDRADQLVEKIEPEQQGRTVVHLLNNSALDFTATYMHARMARPSGAEISGGAAVEPAAGASDPGGAATKAPRNRNRSSARRTPMKNGAGNGGRRVKKEPVEHNGKHADLDGVVPGGDEVKAEAPEASAAKA